MKKYISFFISAFLISILVVEGIVWGFIKTKKIQIDTKAIAKTKIIDVDELVRRLIPDKGEEVERWDIYTNLADYIEWDTLSLNHYSAWRGKCTLSWNGEVPMILRKKLETYVWVYITGDGSEYNGFFIVANCPESVYPDRVFCEPLILKNQFKGKIPVWIYKNTSGMLPIYCYFDPDKKDAFLSAWKKSLIRDLL